MRTKNLFKSMLVAICCISVVAFVACSDDDDDKVDNTLKTNPEKVEVFTGETSKVVITNGESPYTITAIDKEIATAELDEDTIFVTGVKEGVAIMHIIDKNKFNAKVVVNVKDATGILIFDKKDVAIEVDKNDVVTVQGGTKPYTAKVEDEDIATANVDENKVTIKGVKAGKTTITVTDKDKKSGAISVTIK